MPGDEEQGARAKLKKLLGKAGEETTRAGRRVGTETKQRVQAYQAGRTLEGQQIATARREQQLNAAHQAELARASAREQELERRRAVAAEKKRRQDIEREIRELKYGPYVEMARKFGTGATKTLKVAGSGVTEVGKVVAGPKRVEKAIGTVRREGLAGAFFGSEQPRRTTTPIRRQPISKPTTRRRQDLDKLDLELDFEDLNLIGSDLDRLPSIEL